MHDGRVEQFTGARCVRSASIAQEFALEKRAGSGGAARMKGITCVDSCNQRIRC